MEKTLTVGKTYTVTTASECSVTDSNGLVLCTATAGEQKAFVATTSTISFSDDSATVTAVFKGAPSALGLLGGGNSGGSGGGGIEGDYLLYDANCVITGGRIDEVTDISFLCSGKTKQTEWNIPLPNVTNADHAFTSSGVTSWTVDLPKATNVQYLLYGTKSLGVVNASFSNATNSYYAFYGSYAQRVTLRAPKLTNPREAFVAMPNLTYLHLTAPLTTLARICNSSKALSDFYIEGCGTVTDATLAFNGCVLNKDSVFRIVDILPTYSSGTHAITLGIQAALETDAEVSAAIDAATAKGWNVTVQYN